MQDCVNVAKEEHGFWNVDGIRSCKTIFSMYVAFFWLTLYRGRCVTADEAIACEMRGKGSLVPTYSQILTQIVH